MPYVLVVSAPRAILTSAYAGPLPFWFYLAFFSFLPLFLLYIPLEYFVYFFGQKWSEIKVLLFIQDLVILQQESFSEYVLEAENLISLEDSPLSYN